MEAVSYGAINPIFSPNQRPKRVSFEECIASFKKYDREKALARIRQQEPMAKKNNTKMNKN